MSEQLKRRDISGIYIFDKFPTDKKRKPTCVEDCTHGKRMEWCMSKDEDYLRNVIEQLANTFRDLVDFCHSEGCVNDEQRDGMNKMANNIVARSKWNWALHELANQVDFVSEKIRLLADAVGVTKHIEDGEVEIDLI